MLRAFRAEVQFWLASVERTSIRARNQRTPMPMSGALRGAGVQCEWGRTGRTGRTFAL